MEVSARCFAMASPTCALQSPYLYPLPRSLHCDRYFHDAWNVFDFLVIVASFLPFGSNQIAILRLMRLLRLLKLVCLVATAASAHSFCCYINLHTQPRLSTPAGASAAKASNSGDRTAQVLPVHWLCHVDGLYAVLLVGSHWGNECSSTVLCARAAQPKLTCVCVCVAVFARCSSWLATTL